MIIKRSGFGYYIAVDDEGKEYLHSDGVIRFGTRHPETGLMLGYSKTRQEANQVLHDYNEHYVTIGGEG